MIAHVAFPKFRRIGQHGVDVGATDKPADGLIGDTDAEVFLMVILDAERSHSFIIV